MAREDRVKQYVDNHTKEALIKGEQPGVSSSIVAEDLRIQRSDACAVLNKLFKLGHVKKRGTKPVLYFSVEKPKRQIGNSHQQQPYSSKNLETKPNSGWHTPFSELIGSEGSLKAQVELAKAAIVYPPNGLHTLLCGETGVGKSLMAEAMWRYAVEIKAFQSQANSQIPFITFCCADYADNSQLLLSQLFGYVKGAFTGADEEREGLVDRAHGGILFLDEIHRLPPAGQELLFMLVDKGVYRRLGETNEERKAKLMLIGATSEDISSSLLVTFRRRIPVQITLPKINERPLKERIALMAYFVKQEANRLKLPIWISGDAVHTFSYCNCPANIGELRNDLQLCCAKSYLSYLASAADRLIIDGDVIPHRIFSQVRDIKATEASMNRIFKEGIVVQPGEYMPPHMLLDDYELPIDLYGFIDKKIDSYRQMKMPEEDVERQVGKDLEKYFDAAVQAFLKPEVAGIPASIVQRNIWEAANLILNDASNRMSRKYGRKTLVALALHLQQFKERASSGRVIYNPNLKTIQMEHAKAYGIVSDNAIVLTQKLGVAVPADELGFIAMFLVHVSDDLIKPHIGLIVVAHGRGTAQNMVEVANNLLGTDHIRAYDIPLNRSNSKTIEDLKEMISSANEGKGVLMLVDMGFLLTMEDTLAKAIDVSLRIVPNVTTALVLEAGRRVLTSDDNLEQTIGDICDAFDEYSFTLRQRRILHSEITNGTILVTCASGAGVAEKVKEMLLSNFPSVRNMNFVNVGAMTDVPSVIAKLEMNPRLAVGSMDPMLKSVPFMHVTELFAPRGIQKIHALLSQERKQPDQARNNECSIKEAFELIDGQLTKFVKALPIDKVRLCCEELVETIGKKLYRGCLPKDALVRIYLHAACMFDRINEGEALHVPEWSDQIQKERPEEYQQLKQILSDIAEKIVMEVPDSEIYYFLSSLPDSSLSN